MNQESRKTFSQRNERRLRKLERIFIPAIYKVLHKQFKDAAALVRSAGPRQAIKQFREVVMVDGLAEAIQKIYISVGISTGTRVLAEIRKSAKQPESKAGFGLNQKWTDEILNFFKLYLLNKAVLPVSREVRQELIKLVEQGLAEGWSIDKIAFALEQSNFPVTRARLITRTELGKAQWYGEELAKEESEFQTVGTWIAADDRRTRHSHNIMDGKQTKPGENFRVPVYRGKVLTGYDIMTGPGDPNGSAGNVINCRCTRALVAARDSQGKIVMK
jgi:hypothetical protein